MRFARSGRATRSPRIGECPIRRRSRELRPNGAFRDALRALENRIKLFVALPIDKLDRLAAKREVDQIGRSDF